MSLPHSAGVTTHYAVVGAGGFGREVMPLLLAQLAAEIQAGVAQVSFAVEQGFDAGPPVINGVAVVALEKFLACPGPRFFNVAVADSVQRSRIASLCEAAGAVPISICASNGLSMCSNKIGAGMILCPFAMVTSNAVIGRFVHLNIYAYVAHDCEVGDFVTFAPGVKCNGNVRVESHAYLGTAAVIRPGSPGKPLVIGRSAVVGMGAVVTKDVPPGSVVVGNPARTREAG